MKKIISIFSIVGLAILMTACFKDSKVIFTGSLVEFNSTVLTAPTTGVTYPILTLSNNFGAVSTQINLVAAQRDVAENIKVVVDEAETAKAIAALAALRITAIPAVAGVHYSLDNAGTFVLAPKTSTTNMTFRVLNAPANAGRSAVVVFTLQGNGTDIKPSANYKSIGYRIIL